MSEEQFEFLEDYVHAEAQKAKLAAGSFADESSDLVSVKDLVLGLRERLEITQEIHKLLFNNLEMQGTAMHTINFYNLVKKIIIRSGN